MYINKAVFGQSAAFHSVRVRACCEWRLNFQHRRVLTLWVSASCGLILLWEKQPRKSDEAVKVFKTRIAPSFIKDHTGNGCIYPDLRLGQMPKTPRSSEPHARVWLHEWWREFQKTDGINFLPNSVIYIMKIRSLYHPISFYEIIVP